MMMSTRTWKLPIRRLLTALTLICLPLLNLFYLRLDGTTTTTTSIRQGGLVIGNNVSSLSSTHSFVYTDQNQTRRILPKNDKTRTNTKKKPTRNTKRTTTTTRNKKTSKRTSPQPLRIIKHLGHAYAFWSNGQSRFCDVIRKVTNVTTIGVDRPFHLRNNNNNNSSNSNSNNTSYNNNTNSSGLLSPPPPLLRLSLACSNITANHVKHGVGNWITAVYNVRMAAALGMVDLEIRCEGGIRNDVNHLISFFTGYYQAPTEFQTWPHDLPVPTEQIACDNDAGNLRIDSMAHAIQSDLRKLAVTILGTKHELGWGHPMVPSHQPPMVPGVELDDVVIHFRCGDVFGALDRNDFGIIHFSQYKNLISQSNTTSVGIATQPFTKGNFTRERDMEKAEDCRQAVTALVNYLQSFLPNATISIRNDVHEPLAVTYARMVMSKQIIVAYSSFGIFPLVGTFGQGYFQKGNRVNGWSNYLPTTLPNLHMMEAPRMGTGQIMKAGLNATLAWLLSPPSI